jgi:hypothetical protein
LKVWEGIIRKHAGPRWKLEAEEKSVLLFSGAFKIYAKLWEEPGDSQSIINEWEGHGRSPS